MHRGRSQDHYTKMLEAGSAYGSGFQRDSWRFCNALEPHHSPTSQLFYLQMDHHCILSPHWIEQTRLLHKCLWTPQTRGQGSLPSTLGMDRRAFRTPTLDPWGRFQHYHRVGGEKGRPLLSRKWQYNIQRQHRSSKPHRCRNRQWDVYLVQ
jgi:hypothetical protein